jgi:tetratricopeptide (TPR) repeat protein
MPATTHKSPFFDRIGRWPLLIVLVASVWAELPSARAAEIDVMNIIERGRQALLADKYAEAAEAIDEALKMPEFVELDDTVQFNVLLFGAFADRGREDYLGAHEYMLLATEFPDAKAEHWFMRAQYASWVEAWPDALVAVTAIAKRWPESLSTEHALLVSRVAYRANEDGKHKAESLELLNALFAAKFALEWGSQPDGLWHDLISDALERNDLRRAREISKRVQDASTLLHIRADRRFDALVKAEPRTFNLSAAVERECKRLAKAVSANPRSLSVRVQYGYALLEAGRFAELLALTDNVIPRAVSAPTGSPPYDDIADQLNWMYNHKAASLRALGRWEEALTVMEAGRREPEQGDVNVSQAINLGWHYLDYGRPQDALKALDGIDWAHGLSPYGRMQLQHVRYRAYLQLANSKEADDVIAYLREHHEDAEDTWQLVLVDAGDFDGAAALLISRLHDQEKRYKALGEVQEYKPLPRLPKQAEERARWEALLTRADVAAAIDAVGRRETAPFYDVPD